MLEVTVLMSVQPYHSPPQSISVAVEVGPTSRAHRVLLTEVHEVTGEEEAEEANVERGDELLSVKVNHGAQQSPGSSLSVNVKHPQDLEESDTAHCGGC